MSWAHTHTERVRFGDLDAMKHLNNVVFLRYFETARINYLNQLMESHDPVHRTNGFGFIFASCAIDYRSPAHFDEDVDIRVRPADIGTKSLKLEFEMAVGERLIAEGHGILVGYDYESGETVPLPDALKKRLR
jgi:acyl-CoA thioester hydrolase